jgi:hypothetical protein
LPTIEAAPVAGKFNATPASYRQTRYPDKPASAISAVLAGGQVSRIERAIAVGPDDAEGSEFAHEDVGRTGAWLH